MGRCLHALLALVPLVVACRGQDDQATRPLPAPEPSAQTQPLPLEPVSAPAEKPRERAKAPKTDEAREEAAPRPEPDAPAAAPPPAPSAPPAASAVALPAVNAGCQQACQGSLQTCLAQVPADPDGGTNLDGLATCKRALDDCKSKCSP